jgi:hypothetical protein
MLQGQLSVWSARRAPWPQLTPTSPSVRLQPAVSPTVALTSSPRIQISCFCYRLFPAPSADLGKSRRDRFCPILALSAQRGVLRVRSRSHTHTREFLSILRDVRKLTDWMVERDRFEPSVPLVEREGADFCDFPLSARETIEVSEGQLYWKEGACVCLPIGMCRHEAECIGSRARKAGVATSEP